MDNKRLTYKQSIDGHTDVGLGEGVTVAEAICKLADYEDAVEVTHGHWREFSHSALVRWKDGEPVWADRSVFRCSRCDFGTIARHNYCPRCGAKMDGGNEDG